MIKENPHNRYETEKSKILLMEEQLKKAREDADDLFDNAPCGYHYLDEDGYIIRINNTEMDWLGYRREYFQEKRAYDDFFTEESKKKYSIEFPKFKIRGFINNMEFEVIRSNGSVLNILISATAHYDKDGKFSHSKTTVNNITEQKLIAEKVAESEQLYRSLFEFSSVGIGYYKVDGTVISYNNKAAENMGGKPEDFAGKSIFSLFPYEDACVYMHRIQKAAAADGPEEYEDKISLNFGNRWYYSTICKILDLKNNVMGVQIITQDITDRKMKEQEILYLSYHDRLTGVYNRRYYETELARLDDEKYFPLTLIMLDVNGLKLTNDTFGHKTGDEVLKKVAVILTDGCGENDIVARIGGDEFVVLLPFTDEKGAEAAVARFNESIASQNINGISLSVSMGYSVKHKESRDMDEIFMEAENYMYKHKLSDSSSMRSKTIDLIMNSLYEKSSREMNHSKRVSALCEALAEKMSFSKDEVSQIRVAGLLHDIGKIGVDKKILDSPNILNDDEWQEMKKHPEIGFRILNSAKEFSEIARFVFEHHERWDGKGYPKGLKGKDISLQARIIAVADTYDAMTASRTYKAALSEEEAIKEMKDNANKQFDPAIVKLFIKKVIGR